jgi:hypothetical protein
MSGHARYKYLNEEETAEFKRLQDQGRELGIKITTGGGVGETILRAARKKIAKAMLDKHTA